MITVNLLQISGDSTKIELSAVCQEGFVFSFLEITRYNPTTKLDEIPVDLSGELENQRIETLLIPTIFLGNSTTLYKVRLGISEGTPTEATEIITVYCSNTNFTYAYLLNLVLSLADCCLDRVQYDILNRNLSIIFAHNQALRLGRYAEAKYLYDII